MSEPIFFVNRGRGRAAEGPFDETQIIRLIVAGRILASALVAQQGQLRFAPIASHPPFARALQAAKGEPPRTSGELAKPTRKPAAPPVKRNRGVVFGAIFAFFGLALGAVGIGAYVMFDNGGTPAHGAVPSDTEFLLEVGNLHGAAQSLAEVRVLDPQLGASAKLVEDATLDLSAGFAISKSEASALVLAASSFGVAARKLTTAPEGGLLLTFSSAKPVNALLESKRFKYAGLVSSNGRIYTLAGATGAASTSLKVLAAFTLAPQANQLVWFETSKVLFLGAASFALDLARSVSLVAPPLSQNPRFQRAQRDFTDKSDAIAYLDPALLAGPSTSWTSIVGDDLAKAEPIAASLKLVPAGVIGHAVLRVSAAPSPTKPPPLVATQSLTVMDRLPRETFAYVAAATKTQLWGVDLRRLLLEQIALGDAATAKRVSAALAQTEATLQIHFEDVLSSIGDQAALAVLAPTDFRVELPTTQKMAAKFAFLYAQTVEHEAPARALLEQLKGQLSRFGGQAQVQEDASGYAMAASDASFGLALQARVIKGYLCIAVGNDALVERGIRALTAGEETLLTEPAHQAARTALPNSAQLLVWVDAGRVVSSALRGTLLGARGQDYGLARDAVRWTGPERVTAALALSEEQRDGTRAYHVDALNFPAIAGIFLAHRAGF